MNELAVSIAEAARLLSVSPWTIRAWIRADKLKALRLGRIVLLEPETLRCFIQEAKAAKDANPKP